MTDICSLSMEQLAHGYRVGDVSPVEATEAALAGIEAIDPRLNSFITLTSDLVAQPLSSRAASLRPGYQLVCR